MTLRLRFLAGCLLVCLGLGVSAPLTRARANKIQVRQVEAAFRIESGSLAVRVTLVTGEALELEIKDPASIDTILKMAEILGGQRGRMFAEVEDKEVKALQVAVP